MAVVQQAAETSRGRSGPGARSVSIVAGLTVLGLLLRWPSFTDALFGDELSTSYLVTGHSPARIVELLQGNSVDLNPPGFLMVAWATDHLGGGAPEALRAGSLVAGTSAIPLTWLLGRRTVGDLAGLVGAALIALSPFLIFYSTEARAYPYVLALTLLSSVCLLAALDRGRIGWWVAYGVASSAAVYVHYPAIFLLGAQFAWAFLAHRTARAALLATNAAAAVSYLPWLPTLLDNTRSQGVDTIGILNPFGLHTIGVDLGRWALGHQYIPLASVPGRPALAAIAAGLIVAAITLTLEEHRPGSRTLRAREVWLVVVLAGALPVGLGLYSAVGKTVWETRNLIASWPGLALLVGALLTSGHGARRTAAIALVICGCLVGGLEMLSTSRQRPDYVAAARFIDAASPAGSPIVEMPLPTPGPLAPLGDAGLSRIAGAVRRHPVLRLGYPTRERLAAARPYTPVPVDPPAAVARRAAALATGGADIVLVVPGSTSFAALRDAAPSSAMAGLDGFGTARTPALLAAALTQVQPFLAALPGRFRHVQTRTFPGVMPVAVHVLRQDGRAPRRASEPAPVG